MEEQQQSALGQPPTHAADVRVPTSEQEAAKAAELAEARQEHLDRTAGVASPSQPVEQPQPDEQPEQPQPQPVQPDQAPGDQPESEPDQGDDQGGESPQTQESESGSEDTGGGDGTTGDRA